MYPTPTFGYLIFINYYKKLYKKIYYIVLSDKLNTILFISQNSPFFFFFVKISILYLGFKLKLQ